MTIEYDDSKKVKCYGDFVSNPDDRNKSRAFAKIFGVKLMEPAKKLHDRLKRFINHIIDNKGNLLLTQNWQGDFNSIMTIYVIAINNHDYNNI